MRHNIHYGKLGCLCILIGSINDMKLISTPFGIIEISKYSDINNRTDNLKPESNHGKNRNYVSLKKIQVHMECDCGFNEVLTEDIPATWKQFKFLGIKRKVDKATNEPYLFKKEHYEKCDRCSPLIY